MVHLLYKSVQLLVVDHPIIFLHGQLFRLVAPRALLAPIGQENSQDFLTSWWQVLPRLEHEPDGRPPLLLGPQLRVAPVD